MKSILEAVREKVLICDGAMGTMLYSRGFDPRDCYEWLNIEDPGVISDLHREYIESGADIIETNTFGANASRLLKFGFDKKTPRINIAAASLAKKAASEHGVYVAGSIGPLERVSSDKYSTREQVYEIYKEQVLALAEGGVDLFILETFSSLEEIMAALSACKKETGLPVVAQIIFLNGLRTGYGNSLQSVVKSLTEGGADIIGTNCGNGPSAAAEILRALAGKTALPLSAQPNAGYPQVVDGRSMYMTSAEYFAGYAKELVRAGANIIGGCCGTTPAHIRAIKAAIGPAVPVPRPELKERPGIVFVREEAFYEKAGASKPRIIAELLPPKNAGTEKLLDTAVALKSAGAEVLSFPENPLAQVRMSSIAAAGVVKKTLGLEAIFHYTCRDRNLIGLQSDLLGSYALGLRYVLAVTGDPASMGGDPQASSVFDVDSIKLVTLIENMKKAMGLDIRAGVAFNPNFDDMSGQLRRLKRKIEAGAEFVMTQPVFDPGKAAEVCSAVRDLKVPVYLGVLPLVSLKNALYLHNEVPGMRIPGAVLKRMESAGMDRARNEGIDITLGIMERCRDKADGFYLISPLHKYEISAAIIRKFHDLFL